MIGTIPQADWDSYRARFVDESGRVIDNANGDISHSEGQGYGLILAFSAGDRATFEKIWSFTYTELLIRDDGLVAWKWDPKASPHITDRNNATDGDILIAYALGRAGIAWKDQRYLEAATRLANAIGKHTIARNESGVFLLPGARGFSPGERPDGPVINLSYWIFEALPVLASLAPQYDWSSVWRDGLVLLHQASSNAAQLPADWVSIATKGRLRPARGFEPEFGYNSLRIPLYLLRAGISELPWLGSVNKRWKNPSEGVAVVDVRTGEIQERMTDQGYLAMAAVLACAVEGTRIPEAVKSFDPQLYYSSTLYLLSLSLVNEKYKACL